PSVKFRYGYTGREQDKETGYYYYRARYYDPANGRFISVDPAGFGAGDTNLYRYVGNRSTMYTDPSGEFGLPSWNDITQPFQVAGDYWGSAIANGATSFRNMVTSNAQSGLESWSRVAVRGQNRGGIVGGVLQITGSVLGLLSSLATEDNIDKTNETLAFIFGGEIVAGFRWIKSVAAIPWVKTVTPFVKSGLAAIGVYQGGGQVSQAWTGVGENGRQLSVPERVTVGITGLATIGASILSLKTQCFVAGTEIQTINGTKNIEDIHVGDWVLSDDPNTVGEIEYKQVLQTFVKDTTNLVDIYIDGEKITTTEEHPFWVPDVGWVAAKDLHAGTLLQTKTESWLDVDRVEKHGGLTTVYNFEVQGFHTYFVSDLGLLVHNECYNAKEIRQNLETKYGVNNVSSTTVPPQSNRWNLRLAGQRHPTTGIVFNDKGFPVFDDIAVAEVKLSQSGIDGANYTGQMRESTRNIRQQIADGTLSASNFTDSQIRDINGGLAKIDGYTWHHHQDPGRMQLIPTSAHRGMSHIGGYEMWYGK
ncbi:polymorphic toxin-type HINT domain-containing protein, partial [Chamaesiphon sp. VAR_48_metabat_403]|uniref:polymorphic toxin-type HINT domain-containing protein n=1 Tax=Chamaesiphon sp. VAR_48_metabat_403 TaxID=2964700 RepID=UPI00286D8D39